MTDRVVTRVGPARRTRLGWTDRGVLAAGVAAALTVALSAVPRLALAAGSLPPAARPFIWSDVYATYVDRLAGGAVPYWDTFFDYPPGIGYLAGAFALVAADAVAYVVLWTAVVGAAAAVVAAMLARAVGARAAIALWSLSPQLLLHGGSNVDAIPVALLVAAVLMAREGHGLASLAALSVGALTKVFPAVVAPLVVLRLGRAVGWRTAIAGAALFVAVTLVLAAPSLLAPWSSTASVLHQAGRTNVDSVWGILLGLLAGLGVPAAGPVLGLLAGVGFVATYVLGVVPAARRSADPAVGAALAIVALLIWSRLYSPQYSLWLLPFIALLGLPRELFLLLALADLGVFVAVYPLTLVPWPDGDPLPTALLGLLAAGVVARHVALLLAWREISVISRR